MTDIATAIRRKYPGVYLNDIVAAVLQTYGYTLLHTRNGAGGDVDILAGKGALGFDPPRLCVRVASDDQPVGVSDYDNLQGNVRRYGADCGLLVSSGGFTDLVCQENERTFFTVRLWDLDALAGQFCSVYDRLPSELRNAVPITSRLMPPEMLAGAPEL